MYKIENMLKGSLKPIEFVNELAKKNVDIKYPLLKSDIRAIGNYNNSVAEKIMKWVVDKGLGIGTFSWDGDVRRPALCITRGTYPADNGEIGMKRIDFRTRLLKL